MRAMFHSPSRDRRGRLSLAVDLDYGRGRDPMTIRIDVPREFETHAKAWLSQFVGMAQTGQIVPKAPQFAGSDCGCDGASYGALAGPGLGRGLGLGMGAMRSQHALQALGANTASNMLTSLPGSGDTSSVRRARATAKQAALAMRQARRGLPAGRAKMAAIARGVGMGDPRAVQAARKIDDAAKASEIARAIQAGDPRAIRARERLRGFEQTDENAAEAATLIDECLAMQAARLLAEANMYDSPEEALVAMQSFGALPGEGESNAWNEMAEDMTSYQWDSPFDTPAYSNMDLAVAALNDAGSDFGAALGYDASQRAYVDAIDRTLSKARNAQLSAWAYRD